MDNLPNIANIANIETSELKKALLQSVTITAKHIQYMAEIWYELERRGEDLTALKTEITEFLPLIARKQLSAEAALQFAGQKTILNVLPKLPIEEQTRLAHGATVEIMEKQSNGSYQVRNKPLTLLRNKEVNVVFGPHGLRSPEEQKEILEKQTIYKQAESYVVKIDSQGFFKIGHNYITNGDKKVSIKEILSAIGAYYKIDLEDLLRRRTEQTA